MKLIHQKSLNLKTSPANSEEQPTTKLSEEYKRWLKALTSAHSDSRSTDHLTDQISNLTNKKSKYGMDIYMDSIDYSKTAMERDKKLYIIQNP